VPAPKTVLEACGDRFTGHYETLAYTQSPPWVASVLVRLFAISMSRSQAPVLGRSPVSKGGLVLDEMGRWWAALSAMPSSVMSPTKLVALTAEALDMLQNGFRLFLSRHCDRVIRTRFLQLVVKIIYSILRRPQPVRIKYEKALSQGLSSLTAFLTQAEFSGRELFADIKKVTSLAMDDAPLLQACGGDLQVRMLMYQPS